MTTLYVGNTTKQHQDFTFRMPESDKLINLNIPAGTQIPALRDVSEEVANAVVDQHKRYGMVSQAEARKTKGFIGMVYSFDKPVKLDTLQIAFTHNQEILTEKARENLKIVGAATKGALDQISKDGEGSGLPRVELEVVEQPKEGQQATVAQGVEILKDGVAPTKTK